MAEHCAVGYVEGDVPDTTKYKDGRGYWIE